MLTARAIADAVSSSKVRDKGVDCETIFGNDNVCAGAQQGVCDELVRQANAAGGPDNVTTVVIDVAVK